MRASMGLLATEVLKTSNSSLFSQSLYIVVTRKVIFHCCINSAVLHRLKIQVFEAFIFILTFSEKLIKYAKE